MPRITYGEITEAIAATGLMPRGGFSVQPSDAVPNVSSGQAARTLILVGNAGPGMWEQFSRARRETTMTLDEWSEDVIGELAENLDARALFPFTRPYHPFQTWAQKAEPCFTTPTAMSIHHKYGLWHAYRGALAFAETIEVPQFTADASPCVTCVDQPCLSGCPVEAFSSAGYDTEACAAHLSLSDKVDCLSHGCRARRACPIGTDYVYEPAQAQFHMDAFLRAAGVLAAPEACEGAVYKPEQNITGRSASVRQQRGNVSQ
ncbi:MAG: hypothetical protein AAGB04_00820 [Pseudomonadota bacterium]